MEEIKILDVKLVASLIGIAGILITAVLSSFGYLFKTRVETKKSARKVLYLLLEIRYATVNSLFDPEEATNAYFEHFYNRVKLKGIPVEISEIKDPMHNIVQSHFQNIISAMRTDIHDKLLAPYEEALIEFATVKPVLAYRLRGKEKLETVISHTSNYRQNYQNVISQRINEEWLKEILFDSSNDIKKESIFELIELIDKDIILLAKHCGFFDLIDCKKSLAYKKIEPSKHDFKDLDKFIDNIITKIIETTNKPTKPTASGVGY